MKKSALTAALTAIAAAAAPSGVAVAGGYDTPILYSARHMGMGGAAIGYVDDPSAIFHNPAGLAHIGRFSAIADLSLILGKIQSAPNTANQNVESELTVAPFFLVGAGYRINDWLTAGLAFYPVASAGAEYRYDVGVNPFTDETKLIFFELSPSLAANFDLGSAGKLHVGAGYRISYVDLERIKGNPDNPRFFNFNLTGTNFEGFRVGAQYLPVTGVEVGVTYRHKTVTEVSADEGLAGGLEASHIETSFTLPSKLGAGVRLDLDELVAPAVPLSFVFDFEYGFNSQNEQSNIRLTPVNPNIPVTDLTSIFQWEDGITLRPGLEGRAGDFAARLGYIYDSKTANRRFPSSAGTPPTATQTFTAGAGYRLDGLNVNLAYAYRTSGEAVTITSDDTAGNACAACSQPGDYKLRMHGIYLDASYDF